ncbi:MAG: CPBP family intramembrane metalloprotease [Planctomycetes bacterium]|nr:CPBP family intramembrane metalloprotease [Planctomycetota bacterium]
MTTACGLSLMVLSYLFIKHVGGNSLLPYEPRRRVPWNFGVVLLAMGMPLLGIAVFFVGSKEPALEKVESETLLITGWGNFSFMLLFVLGVTVWLATFFRADTRDVGWPTCWQQFTKDVGIGAFAAVAALLPIYVIQLTLVYALQSTTPHPLVKQLQENNSPAMLLLGFAMAVIAAPLFEEFTFRGLLQGWLERREDEVLAFAATERQPPCVTEGIEIDGEENGDGDGDGDDIRRGVARRLLDAPPEFNEATSLRLEPEPLTIETMPSSTSRPTHGWIPDLPHGWTPILISGFVFGLAHIGHGVAPVSLVLFGIVLGYLYQRTHRLVPSIAAHMLFNAYSMVLLWLQLQPT